MQLFPGERTRPDPRAAAPLLSMPVRTLAVFVATEANGPGYDDFTRYSRLEKQQGTGAPWIPVTGYDRITGDNSLVMCPMNSQEASCTLFGLEAWLESQ